MSLKAFHFFFIVVSILFSAYFAGWCFNTYDETQQGFTLAFGIGSILCLGGLVAYLIWFLKKSRNISFMVALVSFGIATLLPSTVQACTVCLGNPNHPMTKAANQGVWFLLMVISAVLVVLAGIFITWGIRSRRQPLPH